MTIAAIIAAACIGFLVGVLLAKRSDAENDARLRQGIKDLAAAIARGASLEKKEIKS